MGSMMTQVLSISSSVTKIRWRPPAFDLLDDDEGVDRHDAMMAVATARLTSAGGSGVLSLWSLHRPFMPLSVVEGHEEGAVADFAWIQTPVVDQKTRNWSKHNSDSIRSATKSESRRIRKIQVAPSNDETVLIRSSGRTDGEAILFDNRDRENEEENVGPNTACIWQHVLSVGRDGKCILQSFVRGKFHNEDRLRFLQHDFTYLYREYHVIGDRPISRVPSSCFAMANLSPFQRGYGSLQVFSVNQKVPSGALNDFKLTGLRRDQQTAQFSGVFREVPLDDDETISLEVENDLVEGRRLPGRC